MYNNEDIERFLEKARSQKEKVEKTIERITSSISDQRVLKSTLNSTFVAEDFDRYDSDVAEQFLHVMELVGIAKQQITVTEEWCPCCKEKIIVSRYGRKICPKCEISVIPHYLVVEYDEFHTMGECHNNIISTKEAITVWRKLLDKGTCGIPSINVCVGDNYLSVVTKRGIDLTMLSSYPDIKGNGDAVALIKELIEELPELEVDGSLEQESIC